MADHRFTAEEQYKFDIITKVIKKEMKPGQATKLLGVSSRQIRRMKVAVKKDGTSAIVHKLKGKRGNHHINSLVKQKALAVIEETYTDFKPTFFRSRPRMRRWSSSATWCWRAER